MAIADNETFELQDVVDEVNPTTDDLTDCFADAQSLYFNTGWKAEYYAAAGNLNNLLMFRDYGIDHSVVTIEVVPDVVTLAAIDGETEDVEVFVNIGGWEVTLKTSWVNTSINGNILTISADDNTGSARQGTVNIRSTTDTSKTTSVEVNQAGSTQSTFTITYSEALNWEWNDLNEYKSFDYSPTASVTIVLTGDTGFFEVTGQGTGTLTIHDIIRNPHPGPRREMYITFSKSGYVDKVVTCIKYQQY